MSLSSRPLCFWEVSMFPYWFNVLASKQGKLDVMGREHATCSPSVGTGGFDFIYMPQSQWTSKPAAWPRKRITEGWAKQLVLIWVCVKNTAPSAKSSVRGEVCQTQPKLSLCPTRSFTLPPSQNLRAAFHLKKCLI